jgi:DNA replication protein DnaC
LVPSIPHLKEGQVDALATCQFIKNNMNVCALGGSGTGKTHLMAAVSRAAVQLGYTVKFMRVSDMLTLLHEASTEKRLGAMMKSLLKVDLLSLDELGYISLNAKKAQLLFDVIAKRSEAGSSIFVTSNFEFSKWKDFISDTVLTKALVGKLAGDSVILNMNGEDYRLASRKP